MKFGICLASLIGIAASAMSVTARAEDPKDARCYELRVYYAAEGKLDDLNSRFRDHTTKLFKKHGITNIGYWTPVENPDRKLYYILAYPSRDAREASWKAFVADPDWVAAKDQSEKNGRLVLKVDSTFLHTTGFSPEVKSSMSKEPRLYELRTYTASPGNLDRLLKRFQDHTMGLFKKHGVTNFGYWVLDKDQKGAEETLVYMLIHKSADAKAESNKAFAADPEWKMAMQESEKEAGGSLTAKDGVKSVLMNPTDYSKSKWSCSIETKGIGQLSDPFINVGENPCQLHRPKLRTRFL
ncbi:MAG: NIPSNAP family protein [Chthonomonadales bacterium]